MKETRIPVLSLQMSVVAMAITSIGLVTPRLTEAFSLTTSQQGMLVGVQYTGATIAALLGGAFCMKYGSAFISRVLFACGALFVLLFGFIPSYPFALLGVFLTGIVNFGLENSIMASGLSIKEKAHFANSVIHTLFSVGAITVPLIFLFFDSFGVWRPVYFTLAVLFAAAFFFSRGAPDTDRSKSIVSLLRGYTRYFSSSKYLLGAAVLFLYVAAEVGLWSLMPILVEATVGGSMSGIISSSLFWSMMLVGRMLSTALMRRVQSRTILLPFGVGAIVCYVLLIFLTGPVAIAFAALAGFFCAPFFAFLSSWATELAGDRSPAYLAFIMAFGMLGPVVLGWVVGILGSLVSGRFIILPALCCLVAMLLLYAVAASRKKASPAREA